MTPNQEARLDRALAQLDELIEERKRSSRRTDLAIPPGPYKVLVNARPPAGGFRPPKERT